MPLNVVLSAYSPPHISRLLYVKLTRKQVHQSDFLHIPCSSTVYGAPKRETIRQLQTVMQLCVISVRHINYYEG